jgi:PAS domain S-box-containing protein
MPAVDYPFIQIAVLPEVREKFAAGQAMVILSPSLDFVYWANGAAAALFGYPSIYAFLDEQAFGDTVTGRQIAATAMQLGPARARQSLLLRLGTGFRRFAAACTLEMLTLPGGEEALLLAMPADARLKDSIARAEAMIEGFGEIETHVAVIDEEANILAASASFPAVGLEPSLMETLVADVDRERSRLVKRVVPTTRGRWPAAIAKLADSPPLYLLFAVEPDEATEPPLPVAGDRQAINPVGEPVAAAEPQAPPSPRPMTPEKAQEPGFVFDREGRPVRFVWKIDAEGRFSELSPEFAQAVGPLAADAIGRTFEELAKVFNLDPEEKISELLRRRDTWSGKTVLWPVQGEAISVPVDLAALPTYTRDRIFDGFRGFGIVRIADAVPDPERIGLALVKEPVDFDATAGTTDLPLPDAAFLGDEPILPTLGMPTGQPAAEAPTMPPAPANTDTALRPGQAGARNGGASDTDPFRGEIPVLRLVDTPARRASDKVIDLQEHRTRGAREGLSKADQAVFQQIGAELGKRLGDAPETGDESAVAPTPPAVAEPDETTEIASQLPVASLPAAEPVAAVALERPPLPVPLPSAEAVSAVRLAATATAPPPAAPGGIEADLSDLAPQPLPAASPRAQLTAGFLDNLPVAALVHRGDRLLRANEAFFRLTGYADLAALDAAGGIGALFAERHGAAMTTGTENEVDLACADGSMMPCQARLQSIGWEDGHALVLMLDARAVSRPIQPAASDPETSEASLALALVEMEELRSILETATDGVIILDETGDIRSVNRSASALFDYDEGELIGQPFAMLFAPESQRAVLDYVGSLTDNGVASVLNDGREVMAREASGGIIPIFMTLGRLSGSNGFCAVLRDITHWKRTEEDLRTAKRAAETANAHKSDFLARVSHEIRTPLNAIIGFAEMMATERFGPMGNPRYQEYAHDIGRSGRHVLDIVNDLLDISKIEAGQLELDFAAVSLNDALAESVSLLQPQANGQRVIIRTSLSASLPEVVADARSIRQIALNLLSNAIRFTPAGGQIVVSTAYEPSGRVIIRVRDTGMGMTRSELEQAMKPFRQASASAARPRGDGTGLGLPLTKAMVEANRAQFTIESAPGEGTLVEIAFPPQRVLAD